MTPHRAPPAPGAAPPRSPGCRAKSHRVSWTADWSRRIGFKSNTSCTTRSVSTKHHQVYANDCTRALAPARDRISVPLITIPPFVMSNLLLQLPN